MSATYLPSANSDLLNWLNNYKTKIQIHGITFGYDAAKIAQLVAWCDDVITAIQQVEVKKNELKSAIDARKASNQTDLAALKADIARQKVNENFTSAIGQELGIVGHGAATFDAVNYKPVITVSITGGHVEIRFKKRGVDGLNLYHRKKGTANWDFLARTTKSPFIDVIVLAVPNQPEHWEYRAYGVKDDEEIGLPSDIVEAVFGG